MSNLSNIISQIRHPIKHFYCQGIPELQRNLSAEIYVISYPKSGRSWLRFMLNKYCSYVYNYEFDLNKDISDISYKTSNIPSIAFVHDGSSYVQKRNFTAEELPENKHQFYKGKKVILLVRDLRDVMVSYYMHCTKRNDIYNGSISDFIKDEYFGIKKAVYFLNIWYAQRHIPKEFLMVHYEDITRNPVNEFLKIIKFMNITVNLEFAKGAVDFASFENMKNLERSGKLELNGRFGSQKKDEEDAYKIRKGIAGGFVDYLDINDIQYINNYIKDNLNPYGNYSLTN